MGRASAFIINAATATGLRILAGAAVDDIAAAIVDVATFGPKAGTGDGSAPLAHATVLAFVEFFAADGHQAKKREHCELSCQQGKTAHHTFHGHSIQGWMRPCKQCTEHLTMKDSPRRFIAHVDMDAFFASVEQRDNPALLGKPVLVGGDGRRAVVAAASYEARRFGVFSAMPMARAKTLCPEAIILPVRTAHYAEVSKAVFAIFRRYTPLVEGLSLDEAFLDLGGSRRLFGDPLQIVRSICAAIDSELGLGASAGVAHNKFLAKMASSCNKPRGFTVVPEDCRPFLWPMPIERMWGVGPKAAERLRTLGFATIGDLARADIRVLEQCLGRWGHDVARLAHGQDERPVITERKPKSLGHEDTFDQDLWQDAQLHQHLLNLAERVARRLFDAGFWAKTLAVKVKFSDFQSRSSQVRLPSASCDTDTLYQHAMACLARIDRDGRGVRLLGISVSDLCTTPQARLFESPQKKRSERLEGVRAALRQRYGKELLTRGTLHRPKNS